MSGNEQEEHESPYSGICQPEEKFLYAFLIQLGDSQFGNIALFYKSAKQQQQLEGIPVGTNRIAAQVALHRQIVRQITRQE